MENINRIYQYFQRQQGFSKVLSYDFALGRLCVAKEDSWRGISPSNLNSDFNPEPPIFSAKFANCDGYRHILAIANEDGKIALQDTTKRNYDRTEKSLSAPQYHNNAVFDLEWAPGQMRFVSASGDHSACLWDVTDSDIRKINSFEAHTRSVKTAAFRKHDPSVFASGGRDGAIIVWDTRADLTSFDLTRIASRPENRICSGHVGGPATPISTRRRLHTKVPTNTPSSSSVTGLVFQDTNTLISCGAGDGIIKVWDLRRNYTTFKKEPLPKYSLPYAGTSTFKGYTNLIANAAGTHLYANCMDNTIYCYNICSYSPQPLARYKGLLNGTFYIKSCLSPDGKYLASGSSDEKAYIWNLDYPNEPLISLSGHNVEVTCVAWGATHDCPLVTCSDDARHKIWRIGPSKLTAQELFDNYCGYAEYVMKLPSHLQKHEPKISENTPKSTKQHIHDPMNQKPVSTAKRSLNALLNDVSQEMEYIQLVKRPKLLEGCGRRLFGYNVSNEADIASTSTAAVHLNGNVLYKEERQQATILEKEEVLNCVALSPSTRENSPTMATTPPPLHNIPCNSLSPSSPPSLINSPTSNLPNYVLDGEAPHLGIMSPKRPLQVKVDWLTKLRKQKQMMSKLNLTLTERIQNCQDANANASLNIITHGDENTTITSPRVQHLKHAEASPRSAITPRRRLSHCNHYYAGSGGNSPNSSPRTLSSTRRNSETTLLRFFSVQRNNSLTAAATNADELRTSKSTLTAAAK
uniref:Uncharacterized protein n=1 Tax=Glossina austeni TaxID=7395 RepID=A0A1A9V2T0_GLOAU